MARTYLPRTVKEKKKTKRKPSQRAPSARWSTVKGSNAQIQSLLSGKGRRKSTIEPSINNGRKTQEHLCPPNG